MHKNGLEELLCNAIRNSFRIYPLYNKSGEKKDIRFEIENCKKRTALHRISALLLDFPLKKIPLLLDTPPSKRPLRVS